MEKGIALTEVRPLRGARAEEAIIQLSASYAASKKNPLTATEIASVLGNPMVETNGATVAILIVDGSQRTQAELLQDTLYEQGYARGGIRLIGSLYVPDTTEIRYFKYPDKKAEAEAIRDTATPRHRAPARPARCPRQLR